MIKALATVVIPTYNYAGKVTRAIESVMKQTLSNFECFIVDDESKDDTERVVKEFIAHDKRFHYIKQKNSGVAVARNHGIAQGSAPYVCCLDADDAIEPLFLEACVKWLESNLDISIAYTRLLWITPEGKEGVGDWPGDFNYENQLNGNNQVPTCCVFRRVMWERLGGYRKRYCPHGAGSEDAEFWLRAGAYGFKAQKITDAPLFIYSFMSGMVSGNKEYREIDWRSLHPWTSDKRHPFPSIAKPRKLSHPVHQYDTPVVSVIIPVGEKHRSLVFDTLDSLEGQSFRDWEAIVVDDSGVNGEWIFDGFPDAFRAYPYVRMIKTEGHKGAGYARNRGVEISRAPLLLFLDADDTLTRETLEEMVIAWGLEQQIIYSNYAGKAYISENELSKFPKEDILQYDQKTKLAVIRHYSAEFECVRAIREPTRSMYIWNLIASLVPRKWHDEIGGFDEHMDAWEDWDYWIRMARAGKCFHKINKDLVVYRFYTGTRRERGLQDHKSLIKYMREKYDKENINMTRNCGGCGSGGKVIRITQVSPQKQNAENLIKTEGKNMTQQISDKDFVLCVYAHPNIGQHKVVGAITRTVYGYRKGGDRFYVDRRDIAAQPNLFKVVEDVIKVDNKPLEAPPEAPKQLAPIPPIMEREITDLQYVPGITPAIRSQLNAAGIHLVKELIDFGEDGLIKLKGVGKSRASMIYQFAKEYTEKHPESV